MGKRLDAQKYIDRQNLKYKFQRSEEIKIVCPFASTILNVASVWKFACGLVVSVYVGIQELTFRENHKQKFAKINHKNVHK